MLNTYKKTYIVLHKNIYDETRSSVTDKFYIFALKFKLLNMENKQLNRIKVVLVEKRRTGVWLAEQLGVSPVTISKWCSNTTQPTLQTLDKIAELLEIDMRELLTSN